MAKRIGNSPFLHTDDGSRILGVANPDGSIFGTPLISCGIPIGMGSSCTVGANGDLSLMTAFQTIYSAGIYLYFGANAFYAGSVAGFYWCIMSSTTAGTAYGNLLDINNPAAVSVAGRIPIVGAGSAYTQTGASITCLQKTIPAGLFGINSSLSSKTIATNNNSVGSKNVTIRLTPAINSCIWANTTSTLVQGENIVFARGTTNSQVTTKTNNALTGAVAVVSAAQYTTADMSVDQVHSVQLQFSTGTDCMVLEAFSSIITG